MESEKGNGVEKGESSRIFAAAETMGLALFNKSPFFGRIPLESLHKNAHWTIAPLFLWVLLQIFTFDCTVRSPSHLICCNIIGTCNLRATYLLRDIFFIKIFNFKYFPLIFSIFFLIFFYLPSIQNISPRWKLIYKKSFLSEIPLIFQDCSVRNTQTKYLKSWGSFLPRRPIERKRKLETAM